MINDFAALNIFVDLFEFASELFDLRVCSVLQSQGPIHWQDMVAGGMTEHDQTITSIEFGGFRHSIWMNMDAYAYGGFNLRRKRWLTAKKHHVSCWSVIFVGLALPLN